MGLGRTKSAVLLFFSIALGLACIVPPLLAKKKDKDNDKGTAPVSQGEQRRALHALNRLTFGPRPGDVQQVMAMGVDQWIDLQLHPEKIPNAAMESRLAPFRTLRMSSREMVENFPDNPMLKQVMDGKRPMPSDPAKRAIYQVQIARMLERKEAREERKADTATASAPPPAADTAKTAEELAAAANTTGGAADSAKTQEELAAAAAASPDAMPATPAGGNAMNAMSTGNSEATSNNAQGGETSMAPPAESASAAPVAAQSAPMDDFEARRREERLYADLEVQTLLDLPPDQRYKKVLSMSSDQQVAFAETLRGGKGQEFLAGLDPKQKETLQAMNNPQ